MDSDPGRSAKARRRPRSVGRLALGLTMAPTLGPLGATVRYSGRSFLAYQRGTPLVTEVPMSRPSLRMAASVVLDETMLHGAALGAALAPAWQYEESLGELDVASSLFRDRGWLEAPGSYFQTPTEISRVKVAAAKIRRGPLELISFDSGYEPHPDEPGRFRWLSYKANRTVYAGMLRHEGAPRPWVIALHGQGMGRLSDLDMLGLRRLHDERGVNVLAPVLPLHGARRQSVALSDSFVSATYPMNNVFGLAQSVWDLQKILSWVREVQQAPAVGVYGFSLGSYVASLLATRDRDLACVAAVAPAADLAGALKVNEPPSSRRRLRLHRAVHDNRSAMVHSVVSPLAQPCLVPVERRFIIAGECDRVAPPEGALELWRHWDQCSIEWQPQGHLTALRGTGLEDRLVKILRAVDVVK